MSTNPDDIENAIETLDEDFSRIEAGLERLWFWFKVVCCIAAGAIAGLVVMLVNAMG